MSSTRSPGLLLAFILCGRDSYKLSWRGVAWRATLLDCCYQRLSCTIGIGVWPKLKGDQEEKENEEKQAPFVLCIFSPTSRGMILRVIINVPTVQILIFFRDTETLIFPMQVSKSHLQWRRE